jgi:hypothetical protein
METNNPYLIKKNSLLMIVFILSAIGAIAVGALHATKFLLDLIIK